MNSVRAFVSGSGSDAFGVPSVAKALIQFIQSGPKSKKEGEPIVVVYLGTATYDLPRFFHAQTDLLSSNGCKVVPLQIADPEKKKISDEDAALLKRADAILVSGGNTSYAVRRWQETGLAAQLKEAAKNQVVLAGGSAGAICWFTSGHSDSANPKTYFFPMALREMGKEEEALKKEEEYISWNYIRVDGLGVLPGLLCPHYDREAQDGQPPRYTDVGKMIKRHPTERCIALDHWVVLQLNGDGTYTVLPIEGKTRLDPPAGETPASEEEIQNKEPAVFTLECVGEDRTLKRRRVPKTGLVEDLLRPANGPTIKDPFAFYYAMANPTPSSGKFVTR